MKKTSKFLIPEAEIVCFHKEDIIVTSNNVGGITYPDPNKPIPDIDD